MKLAIVDTDKNLGNSVSTALSRVYPNAVILQIRNGREALHTLKTQCIDAMLCGLVLPELDGLGLLEAIRTMRHRPRIMVLTQVTNERILARTLTLGADYYMIKPVETAIICKRMAELLDEKETAVPPRTQFMDCAQMLSELGIPTRFAGYHYLLYGIELARQKPEYLERITTRLYPSIAERFGKRPENIERGIRYAVDMAFSRNKWPALSERLDIDESQLTCRPSNRVFMTLLVNAKRPQ